MQQLHYIETTSTPVVTEDIPDLPTDIVSREVTTTEQLQATEPPKRDLVGAEVFYVLGTESLRPGRRVPATIVGDNGNDTVNMQVHTDNLNDFPLGTPGSQGQLWVPSSDYAPGTSHTFNTWHWRSENL